jgi:hypothetical protein
METHRPLNQIELRGTMTKDDPVSIVITQGAIKTGEEIDGR